MLFAGFKVDDGDLTLFGIVAAGVLGNLVGSWIAYAIGYFGRLELVERHRIFHGGKKQLAWADRKWFNRHGDDDRVLLADAADHPDLHLAAGGRGAHAVLAVHRVHLLRLHPVGLRRSAIARSGRWAVHWEDWKDRPSTILGAPHVLAAIVVLVDVSGGPPTDVGRVRARASRRA